MTKFIIILAIFLLGNNTFSQEGEFICNIRNYRFSNVVELGSNNFSQNQYSDFGSLSGFNSSSRYLFQGQEYDSYLGAHLFPFRFYSITAKRFLQPDSKSQYFSPYLYVNSDPINSIDKDGKEGKPLILYELEHTEDSEFSVSSMDLMAEFGDDAHYMSLSSFYSRPPVNLDDWNGNVFIDAHMASTVGDEIELERATVDGKITTTAKEAIYVSPASSPGSHFVGIDSKHIGAKLSEYSEKNRVPVRNVFAGGCEGGAAAKGIKDGFIEKIKPFSSKTELKAFGLKANYESLIAGKLRSRGNGRYEGMDDLRFYYAKDNLAVRKIKKSQGSGRQKKVIGYKGVNAAKKEVELPYMDSSEIRRALSEEMALTHQPFFDFHTAIY